MTEKRRTWTRPIAPPQRRAGGEGYTFFVRMARLLFPVAALAMVGVVVARLSSDPEQQTLPDLKDSTHTRAGDIALENAKYEGTDDRGQAYTLTADAVKRADDSSDKILLTKPKADIALVSGNWLAIYADSGSYDMKTTQMQLDGEVSVFHDAGFEAHLQTLDLDLKTHMASSDMPVHMQGPLGTLSAASMTVAAGGDKIVFAGPVSMTLALSPKGIQ